MELAGFIMHYRPGVHKSRVTKSCAVEVTVLWARSLDLSSCQVSGV